MLAGEVRSAEFAGGGNEEQLDPSFPYQEGPKKLPYSTA
jgi:hypothetical protein